MVGVIEHYDTYDEDIRLVKDKVHKVEYSTTLYILDKYIVKNIVCQVNQYIDLLNIFRGIVLHKWLRSVQKTAHRA